MPQAYRELTCDTCTDAMMLVQEENTTTIVVCNDCRENFVTVEDGGESLYNEKEVYYNEITNSYHFDPS